MFGPVTNPFTRLAPGTGLATSTSGRGLILIITSLFRFAIVAAGIYTLINFILAGYGYLSAGGDVKLVQKSTERIWRSFLGLIVVVSSTVLAGIVGYILYGPSGWRLLISPVIYAP